MKKIIVFALLLITATASYSQQITPSPALTKQDYLKKSKHQKTAAWLLLGGGIVMSSTSLILFSKKGAEDVWNVFPGIISGDPKPVNDYTAETILLAVGGVAMLTSVPLFIASAKNKKKGMSLAFKNETTQQLRKSSFVSRPLPSLGLTIHL